MKEEHTRIVDRVITIAITVHDEEMVKLCKRAREGDKMALRGVLEFYKRVNDASSSAPR